MKKNTIFFVVISLLAITASAQERGPVVVSPGKDTGIARVGVSCPTFSWTGMEWATGYKVVVFETNGPNVLSYDEMTTISSPVLNREIQGRALSWTPSSDERLISGRMYVWYVQAVDGYGQGIWSEGRMFEVEADVQLVGMEDTVRDSLREKGMSEEAIEDVLEDMRLGTKEAVAYGVDVEGSEDEEQGKIGIQGTEGTSNTFYGLEAGLSITSGLRNSFFGRAAGYTNSEGDSNTFMGYQAGYSNTSGGANNFIGSAAGFYNTTGDHNTFIGYYAGFANSSGVYNTFLGSEAGFAHSTGSSNTVVGYSAGHSHTTGGHNTFIGNCAGCNNSTGVGNIFLGSNAGYNETGSNKLYIDNSNTSSPLIWGDFTSDILTVHGKLGIGTKSPAYQMEVETTGTNAILLLDRTDGAKTGFSASGDKAVFGTLSNHPLHCVINGIFRMELRPNGSMHMSTGARCTEAGVWVDASSREYKEDIQALSTEEAMDALQELNPMKYRYKREKDEQYLGFIAEDVPELVASKDRKNMSAMDVVAVLTKVVQEQQKTIAELQKQIDELRNGEK